MRALARLVLVSALAGSAALADAALPGTGQPTETWSTAPALLAADVSVPPRTSHRAAPLPRPSLPARSFRPVTVAPASRSVARPPRPATHHDACDRGAGWRERRVERALRSIDYPWRDLGYRLEVRAAKQGYLGMTYPAQRLIVLWVRGCRAETDVMLRVTLAHEIGHAVDFSYGSDARRARWLQLRGAEGTPWFCCGADDFSLGAGDFAEVFAYWQAGPGYYLSRVARAPSRSELADLISLFFPS